MTDPAKTPSAEAGADELPPLPYHACFRLRYREPRMSSPRPWAYADPMERGLDRMECEYEDLFTAAQMRDYARAAIRQHLGAQRVGMAWIPCAERLPQHGETVAFVVSTNPDSPVGYMNGRVYGGRYSSDEFGGFSVPGWTMNASHWLPLPPAPTEKAKT